MLTVGRCVAFTTGQLARRTLARMATMRLRMVTARRLAARLLAARRLCLALAAARYRGRRLATAAAHCVALLTRITLALVAQCRALVLAARQLLAAHFVARRTLAVAALAVARVLRTRAQLAALRVARELLAAGHLLGLAAAAALLVADDQTLAAAAVVTALRADVLAALERLVAGAAARLHVLAARRLRVLLAARTAARLVARTLAARSRAVAELLAAVSTACVRPAAPAIALPAPFAALALAHRIAALAAMLRPAFARCARIGRMAGSTALVRSARQLRRALLLACPGALRTANCACRGLLTQAFGLNVLRARRTRPGMAEQNAAMAAVRLQAFLAQFAARMRHQPRVIGRIQLFGAEASVVARYVGVSIVLATLGTVPLDADLLFGNEFAAIVVVRYLGILLDAFLGGAVVGPTLDAREVKEVVAITARPNL